MTAQGRPSLRITVPSGISTRRPTDASLALAATGKDAPNQVSPRTVERADVCTEFMVSTARPRHEGEAAHDDRPFSPSVGPPSAATIGP